MSNRHFVEVGTKLFLQDDPPNPPEFFSDDAGDDHSGLNAELTMTMLQDQSSRDSSDPGVEFTGTTINLQDLE